MAVRNIIFRIPTPLFGAYILAGLAGNSASQDKPAKEKLLFSGDSIFIPIFFIVTGFLINPVTFIKTISSNFALVMAIILALLQLLVRSCQDGVVTHIAAGSGYSRRRPCRL